MKKKKLNVRQPNKNKLNVFFCKDFSQGVPWDLFLSWNIEEFIIIFW